MTIPPDTDLFWAPHYNIPLVYGGRLLVTVHDVLHLARPEFVRGVHRRYFARLMFRALRDRACVVICDSKFTADELERHAGVDRRRIEVVHLGVDEAWFAAGGESPREKPYFVFVGNVKPHKNLRGLITAFASIRDRFPHDLVVIGRKEGFISGDAQVLAGAAELGNRCVFMGELEDEEVRRYVRHAEALVLPSFYEGFGLPALEAMAAGCPVIVSRAASLPEVCGEVALYCDPAIPGDIARQMGRMAEDESLRRHLVCTGRERAKAFRWDTCARQTRDIIAKVLGE